MEQQRQIKRRFSDPESIEVIRGLLGEGVHSNRAALAQATCSHFGFVDARGRTQTTGCVKALRELEQMGHFALPSTGRGGRRPGQAGSAGRLGQPVPEPHDVPAAAGDVPGLALLKVQSLDALRLWNELMACDHPQGPGPLVGAQMRYLIASDCGWLGGMGFGAAALNLADRPKRCANAAAATR